MRNLIILVLIFTGNFIQAQIVKGIITDEGNKPLSSVSVLAKNQRTQIIEKFTTTKGNGEFIINLSEASDTILLEVYKLGYEKEFKTIYKSELVENQKTDFILIKSNIQLQEVFIKNTRPFTVKDDTVNYNVNHYKSDLDKNIEDVLRKMPGIKVEEDGTIKYKNKPIEKLLLDGDDLFGSQYTNGSKNISPEIIDQVQAIENFEENPLLKNVKHTDQVALNLKLKKGMADFSANFDLSGGIENRLQTKANGLTVSNAIKNFTTISFNNTGFNETPYDYFSGNSDVASSKISEELAAKAINETSFSSDVGTQRANQNEYWYGNTNTIFKFSKATNLRLNFTALDDRLQYETSNNTTYNFSGDSIINLSERNKVVKKPTLYDLNLKLTWKNKNRSMIENDLIYRFEKSATDNFYDSNYRNQFNSKLVSKNKYFRNHFLYTEKINTKNSLQLYTQFSVNDKPQNFSLSPGFDYLGLNNLVSTSDQLSSFSKYFTNFGFNFYGRNKLGKYEINANQSIIQNKLESKLSQDQEDLGNDFRNDLDYKILNSTIEGKYSFVFGKLTWINHLKLKNYWLNANQEKLNRSVFNPKINLVYRFDMQNNIKLNFISDQNLPQENNLFQNYILTNHRTLKRNSTAFDFQKYNNVSLDFSSQSAYRQFSWMLTGYYQTNQNNIFSTILIENDVTKIVSYLLDTKNESFGFSTTVEKYYYPLRTNFRLRASYNWMNYQNQVNNSDLRTNINQSYSINFFMKSAFNFPINFENNFNFQYNQNKTEGLTQKFDFSSFNNSAKLIIKPSKSIFFNVTWDFYQPNLDSNSKYHFLDTYMFFKPQKENYTLYLRGANLLNNKSFDVKNISDYYSNLSNYSLNQRYILLGINFKL
ncbi:TonB-dependent receptor [Faecalibacter macacae]|uniref:TonB-dependent receptor n=1 Tax=Faecalibacter macacae TaxID=1859289 RepID=A0A3L9MDC3_9FLAO|nr:TonB-dependent receptor [Faecalibacter macacae]RLZ09244.1 TonB-dependent receptor [Faecalibacter macacae]